MSSLPQTGIASFHLAKSSAIQIPSPTRSFSGSAFPATLAIQIRQLAPEGFSLDAIATVIDCVNFEGYEDTSPTAKVGLHS